MHTHIPLHTGGQNALHLLTKSNPLRPTTKLAHFNDTDFIKHLGETLASPGGCIKDLMQEMKAFGHVYCVEGLTPQLSHQQGTESSVKY